MCLGLLGPTLAHAQPAPTPEPPPAPAPEAPPLEDKVKALEADLEDMKDETTDLKSELADLKARQAASKPPASLNAMNPQITAFLNGPCSPRAACRSMIARSRARPSSTFAQR
jgi:hypothetical protein